MKGPEEATLWCCLKF
uniref:Uncharacterized protein n=1 Tax=Anguilla anguilla TaxID=7936 RepID=A0A0E9PVZ0_ANGAN